MIIKVANNGTPAVLDVFTGQGWNNWSRFEATMNKGKIFLKLVKGTPMAKDDFATLYQTLSAK